MRLAGSVNDNEGKLEIYHNNSWKKVCTKHWTLTEANVVCRELRYSKAVDFKGPLRNYSNKSLDYSRMKINCTGKEKNLHNCFRIEDTKVRCDKGSVHVRCVGNEGGKVNTLYFFLGPISPTTCNTVSCGSEIHNFHTI